MRKAKAYLKCIKKRKDGTEYPKFSLTYMGKLVGEFEADHMGEASQIARWILNEKFGHLKVMYEWRD